MRAPGGGEVVGVVALAGEGQAVVALVSLEKLLAQQAPWWVAEKHAVAIVDVDDAPLATRARAAADPAIAPYKMAIGDATQGLFVSLAAYPRPTNLVRNALLGAIGALALVTAVALWTRARHLRRRREAELRLREEYAFRTAMENSLTVGMRARDLQGAVTSVNPAFCRMVGWSQEELVGTRPPMPYWREEDIERTRAFHDSVLEGRAPKNGMELRFRRRDGTEFDALVYEAPLIDAQGRQKGWIGSFVDVTARKQAEALAREQSETLERTARLVTIGEMASLVAHELNQPLAAISGYTAGMLNLVDAGAADEAAMRGALSKSAEAARRAGRIIQRVQDFVRRSEPRREPFDLAALARECVEFFQRDAADVVVTLDLAADAPPALGDRVLIEQVIINLLRNAGEATGAQAERRIAVSLTVEGEDLAFSVADNGPGLSPEIEARLFTPFATTKRTGMGLGLTICRSILEVHRGRLTGANAAGGGAVFAFRLRGAGPEPAQGRAVA
ncbi:MAG: PAS domain S-box protein [Rhizobiales bacterium]|nr:PAS domain S-box protein [Hyphomicrobiales bacterium]